MPPDGPPDVGSKAGKRAPSGLALFCSREVLVGLTLAAITIPEQMATARLGGFEPQVGLFAFVAATLGFAAVGANRLTTVGADTTITPIFAGSLAILAASGASLGASAVSLAFLVGAILALAGFLRLGWVAGLLSTPVLTGFLAGIAVHILVSQLPTLFALPGGHHEVVAQLASIYDQRSAISPVASSIGLSVLAAMLICERFAPRLPGALIAVALATLASFYLELEVRGLPVLGILPQGLPHVFVPDFGPDHLRELVPLALVVALVVMMQTAAVAQAFRDPDGGEANVDRDFLGIGAANLLAGLAGAFPVNASPPRTAVVAESGGRSQLGALVAAALVLALAMAGGSLLAHVPQAALAGVLLFVAKRIFRLSTIMAVARQAPAEFALILFTALAIILLPIETGVAIGVGLSLLHGVWATTRSEAIELCRIVGTTIWWPPGDGEAEEEVSGVLVVAFQAPLLFANAIGFKRGLVGLVERRRPHLVVLEAGSIAVVDYTAAQALLAVIAVCHSRGATIAIARLESVRAHEALTRFGVIAALGPGHVFRSVEEAVRSLAPP